jgi:hypothetical protein
MNYYIPFKALSTKNPRITLNKKSKFFDTDDIEESNTSVYFDLQRNEKHNDNRILPDALIYHDTIIGNDIIKNILTSFSNEIKFKRCVLIDEQNHFHEDFWILKPSKKDTAIDLNKSVYKIKNEIDKTNPLFDKYRFDEIKTKTIQRDIFIDTYIKEIVISTHILEMLKEKKVIGLSFLDVENFSDEKLFQPNSDIIEIY